jgi:tetratricopeptide (TPR) repeat protein
LLLLFLLLFVLLYVSRDAIYSGLPEWEVADGQDSVIVMAQQGETDPPPGQGEVGRQAPQPADLQDVPRLEGAEGRLDRGGLEAPVAQPDAAGHPPGEDAGPGEQGAAETADAVLGSADAEVTEQAASQPEIPAVTSEQILNTWQQARIAAWYGDSARAIEYYQTVITLQPDNFDAYGEMGDVMLYSGDRDGAVAAYYQAALLLDETPYRHLAWYLLQVIAGLDPQSADQLYGQLLDRSQP